MHVTLVPYRFMPKLHNGVNHYIPIDDIFDHEFNDEGMCNCCAEPITDNSGNPVGILHNPHDMRDMIMEVQMSKLPFHECLERREEYMEIIRSYYEDEDIDQDQFTRLRLDMEAAINNRFNVN